MRKPAICIWENKGADQLRGLQLQSYCTADQCLCLSIYLSFVAVQPGLCRTLSETPKTGFLVTGLILCIYVMILLFIIIQLKVCQGSLFVFA